MATVLGMDGISETMNTSSQHILKSISICSAAGILLGTGCSDNSVFGVSQNNLREKRGVPIIESDWVVYHSNGSETHWVPQSKHQQGARHSGKKVFHGDGKLLREEDYYHSGADFVPGWDPDSGRISETLTIAYDDSDAKNPWTCTLVDSNGITRIFLSMAEVKLESWNLSIFRESAAM